MRSILFALIALPLIFLIALTFGSPKHQTLDSAVEGSTADYANMTDAELHTRARDDLARKSGGTTADALEGLLLSESFNEISRRDAERAKANREKFEAQLKRDGQQQRRDAIDQQRREDEEADQMLREAEENASSERPRDPQQEADIRELDRLANRQ